MEIIALIGNSSNSSRAAATVAWHNLRCEYKLGSGHLAQGTVATGGCPLCTVCASVCVGLVRGALKRINGRRRRLLTVMLLLLLSLLPGRVNGDLCLSINAASPS